jgi:hypothetical protein
VKGTSEYLRQFGFKPKIADRESKIVYQTSFFSLFKAMLQSFLTTEWLRGFHRQGRYETQRAQRSIERHKRDACASSSLFTPSPLHTTHTHLTPQDPQTKKGQPDFSGYPFFKDSIPGVSYLSGIIDLV